MMVREARAADYEPVKSMLEDAGLPTEDLAREHLAFVVEDEGRVVAAVGFQGFGHAGLLRSLVVEDGTRFRGLGRQLVAALEARATERGVREIWLLTMGADRYFMGQGYEVRDRGEVPPAIRGTAEFTELCPDNATPMSKMLG